MKSIYLIFFVLLSMILVKCVEENTTIPKPLGYYRIDLPSHEYDVFASYECPFSFEFPKFAVLMDNPQSQSTCNKNIYYPKLKATVYLTYFSIDSNLIEISKIIDEKVYSHHNKASGIQPKEFSNSEENVYGTSFSLMGNTAVNYLFYVTDSTNHYFAGQLYFETVPNYDSLQPCIQYIEEDMQHLIETFKWK